MFERFTDRARRAVVLAQEQARELNHNYIGTEHLLLGLVADAESVAGRALTSFDLALDGLREGVLQIIGRGKDEAGAMHIPFTPRAKKVLEMSLREALQLGHNYIGTEHILLGLIREAEGVAAQVLVSRGIDLMLVRQKVVELLSGGTARSTLTAEATGESTVEVQVGVSGSIAGPTCRCGSPLEVSARYRILEVSEQGGDGKAQVLFLYCEHCGNTIDQVIAPGES